MHTIDTTLADVEREWKAYGVSRRDRATLAADLRSDLHSAADNGADPDTLIGTDVRRFARHLADEAGVSRNRSEYSRVVSTSLIGSTLGLITGFALLLLLHPAMVALVDLPRGKTLDKTWMWAGILLFYTVLVAAVTAGAVLTTRLRLSDLPHARRTTQAMTVTMPLAGALTLPALLGLPQLLGDDANVLLIVAEVTLGIGATIGAVVIARDWASRTPTAP